MGGICCCLSNCQNPDELVNSSNEDIQIEISHEIDAINNETISTNGPYFIEENQNIARGTTERNSVLSLSKNRLSNNEIQINTSRIFRQNDVLSRNRYSNQENQPPISILDDNIRKQQIIQQQIDIEASIRRINERRNITSRPAKKLQDQVIIPNFTPRVREVSYIKLEKTDSEYNEIEQQFLNTTKRNLVYILSIHRIENYNLMARYMLPLV